MVNLLLVCNCGTLSMAQWARIIGPTAAASITSEVM
jgi:hypothetical protein